MIISWEDVMYYVLISLAIIWIVSSCACTKPDLKADALRCKKEDQTCATRNGEESYWCEY